MSGFNDELRERAAKVTKSAEGILGALETERAGEIVPTQAERLAAREHVEKALVARAGTPASNAQPDVQDIAAMFTWYGALYPPYDPETLLALYEHSNALRPNVEAYAVNIEAFGYQLEPVIDLESPEAAVKIGDAIFLDRLRSAEHRDGIAAQAVYPSAPEIASKLEEVKVLMRLEHERVTNFFSFCVADMSFEELRGITRQDFETTGNGYWEVLRNGKKEISQFVYVPSHTMRLLPIDKGFQQVTVRQPVSVLSSETVAQQRRFRRYIQIVYDRVVYFKELGDPRVISRTTNREYPSVEALLKDDPNDAPATEIIHFRVFSPRTPYGVPRWIGVLLSVLGSRASEEVNYLYFDNKAIPPLAVLVSGGTMAPGAKESIETYLRDNLKGRENFHKILLIEATSGGPPGVASPADGRTRIELKPLRDAQQQDALFQVYDERNIDKVGMAFRMPRLLRGDVRDFNRATADAALQFSETQVFQPERGKGDGLLNRRVLSELGIRFWRFKSNSPVNRDPKEVADVAKIFSDGGGLTPADMRDLAGEAFNRKFSALEEDWTKLPLPLTLAGLSPQIDDAAALDEAGATTPLAGAPGPTAAATDRPVTPAERSLQAAAVGLQRLRGALRAAEHKAYERRFPVLKGAEDDGEILTFEVPKEVFAGWLEREPA